MGTETYSVREAAVLLGMTERVLRKYLTEFAAFLRLAQPAAPVIAADAVERIVAIRRELERPEFGRIRELMQKDLAGARYHSRIGRYFDPAKAGQQPDALAQMRVSGTVIGTLMTALALINAYVERPARLQDLADLRQLAGEVQKLEAVLNKNFAARDLHIGRAKIIFELNYEREGFKFPFTIVRYPDIIASEASIPEFDLDFSTWIDDGEVVRGLCVFQTGAGGLHKAFTIDAGIASPATGITALQEALFIEQYPFEFFVKTTGGTFWHVAIESFDTSEQHVTFHVHVV